jgi:hypothetical protein
LFAYNQKFQAEKPVKRTFIKGQYAVLILTEEFAADLGNFFVRGKADRHLFLTSNKYLPVKNTLG